MSKRVVELFAGVGGFRLGFNYASDSWEFVYANQWEPSRKSQWAYECYCEHFGYKDIHTNIDIAKINKKDIPDHDILVGGFPCQDYSVARTKAKGIQGKKGVLWWDIYETVKEKRPNYIVLENVDRLLISPSKQRGRDFGVMLYSLYKLGYTVEWRVINAAEYGHPQRRRRVFIYANYQDTKHYIELDKFKPKDILYSKGFFARRFKVKEENPDKIEKISLDNYADIVEVSDKFKFDFRNTGFINSNGQIFTVETKPDYDGDFKILEDILEENPDEEYYITKDLDDWAYLKGSKRIERTSKSGHKYIFSEGAIAFPDPIDKPARTILTGESSKSRTTHVIRDPKTKKLRKLTPIEVERLNGFPDEWTNTKNMSNSFRYFCMGNALVVDVVKEIAKELNSVIDEKVRY